MMITWERFGVTLVVLLTSMAAYLFISLENKVEEQSKQITKVTKQMDVVLSILSMKMPDVNLPALVTIAAQKEVPSEKMTVAVPLLSNNPIQAKAYMKSQMKFNDKEIDLIMQPTHPQVNTFQKLQ